MGGFTHTDTHTDTQIQLSHIRCDATFLLILRDMSSYLAVFTFASLSVLFLFLWTCFL